MKTVLIVDDTEDIRRLAQIALRRLSGWRAISVASGEEAVAVTEEQGVDAVLLDFRMPGMDGPATLRELRERPATKTVPVIFLTATDRLDVAPYRDLGLTGVIAKPFDPLRLGQQMEALLEQRA